VTLDDSEVRSLASVFSTDPVSAALAKIIRGLRPGDRLPSERDLSTQLDVSRTALRDRLGVLEGLGVLTRRTGSGTFVETLKPDALAVALNLAISSSHIPLASLESVRIALERQAAHEAATRSDPVLIGYMARAVDTMERTNVRSEVIEADRAFHQSLLRAAGNPALTFFADALADVLAEDLADRSARLNDARLPTSIQTLMVDHHRSIQSAILAGDSAAAMRAVDDHFNALPTS
jgi:GntR family transcriptional regulator, transcriptional repressor for pyruvate dehydrogenase complex